MGALDALNPFATKGHFWATGYVEGTMRLYGPWDSMPEARENMASCPASRVKYWPLQTTNEGEAKSRINRALRGSILADDAGAGPLASAENKPRVGPFSGGPQVAEDEDL